MGELCMMSALHQDGTPWAGADDYDGVAIERGIDDKHSRYPQLVTSDRVSDPGLRGGRPMAGGARMSTAW